MANENGSSREYDDALRALDEVVRGLAHIKARPVSAATAEAVGLCLDGLRETKLVFERFRMSGVPAPSRETLSSKVEKILGK